MFLLLNLLIPGKTGDAGSSREGMKGDLGEAGFDGVDGFPGMPGAPGRNKINLLVRSSYVLWGLMSSYVYMVILFIYKIGFWFIDFVEIKWIMILILVYYNQLFGCSI